jgi:hypothetical protein
MPPVVHLRDTRRIGQQDQVTDESPVRLRQADSASVRRKAGKTHLLDFLRSPVAPSGVLKIMNRHRKQAEHLEAREACAGCAQKPSPCLDEACHAHQRIGDMKTVVIGGLSNPTRPGTTRRLHRFGAIDQHARHHGATTKR